MLVLSDPTERPVTRAKQKRNEAVAVDTYTLGALDLSRDEWIVLQRAPFSLIMDILKSAVTKRWAVAFTLRNRVLYEADLDASDAQELRRIHDEWMGIPLRGARRA
jgi:hypothetical protein